ncbi:MULTISPECIES: methylated-DNA--[protein]-cysteine S-methyltransferase [unclassified Paludibacterium]|uniref:methylated-DNA--[protein]-cysteine S-methyltransferase n=1 Tax=unclassified Paludibacterium TaxID=2618429 RepID=UPI001C04A841|nr:methylated-DNA--[protein]-cysteine S-methyltransferase [Paludibacterium sp. B53371]BEV72101.1 methylated-DNA--[protein]-cysteine S-methyltransferase [Paludibacterium sp. THUN1379]
MNESVVITVPFGCLAIETYEDRLASIRFLPGDHPLSAPQRGGLAEEAVRQVQAWLVDPHFVFSLPFLLQGSDFQRRVWQRIAAIPLAQTLSYGALAQELGSVARAVGGACGRNPLPLVIPCHRVVAASGSGGFNQSAGRETVSIKEWLLAHERRA